MAGETTGSALTVRLVVPVLEQPDADWVTLKFVVPGEVPRIGTEVPVAPEGKVVTEPVAEKVPEAPKPVPAVIDNALSLPTQTGLPPLSIVMVGLGLTLMVTVPVQPLLVVKAMVTAPLPDPLAVTVGFWAPAVGVGIIPGLSLVQDPARFDVRATDPPRQMVGAEVGVSVGLVQKGTGEIERVVPSYLR